MNKDLQIPQYSFLDSLQLPGEIKRRISQSLDSVVRGSSDVVRTPFMKGKDPSEILTEFDKVFNSNDSALTPMLREIELAQRSKFGPRSLALPWDARANDVRSYFEAEQVEANLDWTPLKIKIESNWGRLRPTDLSSAAAFAKNNTSSGLPYLDKKGNVKDIAVRDFTQILERKDPCMLYTRTQEALKTRTVWGFPIADTLNEMRFFKPLLDVEKRLFPWRSAVVSPTAVDKSITRMILAAKASDLQLVSIDFRGYDKLVKRSLQMGAFQLIESLFQSRYAEELGYIEERFNTIGLITPEGIWTGSHGVPSGSTFTNSVDSIAQLGIAISQEVDLELMQIQGDDGAYCVKDPEALKRAFVENGLDVNDDKTYVAKDFVVYLQNYYSPEYMRNGYIGGIYPVYRAITRLVFQESWDEFVGDGIKGSDYYSIRAISILENCRYHPMFEQLVKFVAANDKYHLQVTEKGLTAYVRRMQQSSGTQGILSNRYGDEVKGLRNFETYKILSAL